VGEQPPPATQMSKLFKGMGSRMTGGMKPSNASCPKCKANKDSADKGVEAPTNFRNLPKR
jgi:hypothetical protein